MNDERQNMRTVEDINADYALLAAEHRIFYPLNGKLRSLSLKQEPAFLMEMLPLIERNTDDSYRILEVIISGMNEASIRWILDAQKSLGGVSFTEAKNFLRSFDFYIGKGYLRKPKRVKSDPQKMKALHVITRALAEHANASDIRFVPNSQTVPLGWTEIDNQRAYYLTDKEVLAFVLDHAEHADDMATYIRANGIHLPALEHIVSGGTKAVSNGAL